MFQQRQVCACMKPQNLDLLNRINTRLSDELQGEG